MPRKVHNTGKGGEGGLEESLKEGSREEGGRRARGTEGLKKEDMEEAGREGKRGKMEGRALISSTKN